MAHSRPQYDKPAISKASTSWTLNAESAVAAVKAYISGYVCRSEMTDVPNDEVAIGSDLDGCRKWFDKFVGTGDAGFEVALEDAEREILEDLKFPAVRREIWAEARCFQQEIFDASSG